MADSFRTQPAQPEGEGLTDEELLKVFLEAKAADMRRQGGLTSSDANGIAKQLDAQTVAGIRAVLTRWGHPTPQPDLATRLALHPDGTPMVSIGKAAPLSELGRLAADPDHSRSVMSPADGEVEELVEWLTMLRDRPKSEPCVAATFDHKLTRAAELLQHQHPQPEDTNV